MNARPTGGRAGILRFAAKLRGLANPTPAQVRPLLEEWRDIIVEDNRKGVLQGRDKDDQPMPALKYRGGAGKKTASRPRSSASFGSLDRRKAAAINREFLGRHARGVRNNNLLAAQYRGQDGPRLAPRGAASRAITNFKTGWLRSGPRSWRVVAGWHGVVNGKGGHFLPYHFDGAGNNPKYDLRGVRDWGRRRLREALRDWTRALTRGT